MRGGGASAARRPLMAEISVRRRGLSAGAVGRDRAVAELAARAPRGGQRAEVDRRRRRLAVATALRIVAKCDAAAPRPQERNPVVSPGRHPCRGERDRVPLASVGGGVSLCQQRARMTVVVGVQADGELFARRRCVEVDRDRTQRAGGGGNALECLRDAGWVGVGLRLEALIAEQDGATAWGG